MIRHKLREVFQSNRILKAAALLGSYAVWVSVLKLIALSLVTYILMAGQSRFQEISESAASIELLTAGLCAFGFVLVMKWLSPMTSGSTLSWGEFFNPFRIERRFGPGFLHGSLLALFVTIAFLMSGLFKYLGFFIQPEEGWLGIAAIAIRVIAILLLVYSEEYLFRQKLLTLLSPMLSEAVAILIVALAFCGIKFLQFEMGWAQILTLFLLSLSVSIRTLVDSDFGRGAGFIAGMLIVFHPLLSLPIFGGDFNGAILVKYQASDLDSDFYRVLTGGAGGPLSSLALQALLVMDVLQGCIRNKKILFKPLSSG